MKCDKTFSCENLQDIVQSNSNEAHAHMKSWDVCTITEHCDWLHVALHVFLRILTWFWMILACFCMILAWFACDFHIAFMIFHVFTHNLVLFVMTLHGVMQRLWKPRVTSWEPCAMSHDIAQYFKDIYVKFALCWYNVKLGFCNVMRTSNVICMDYEQVIPMHSPQLFLWKLCETDSYDLASQWDRGFIDEALLGNNPVNPLEVNSQWDLRCRWNLS